MSSPPVLPRWAGVFSSARRGGLGSLQLAGGAVRDGWQRCGCRLGLMGSRWLQRVCAGAPGAARGGTLARRLRKSVVRSHVTGFCFRAWAEFLTEEECRVPSLKVGLAVVSRIRELDLVSWEDKRRGRRLRGAWAGGWTLSCPVLCPGQRFAFNESSYRNVQP